jgi:hypothetical protein
MRSFVCSNIQIIQGEKGNLETRMMIFLMVLFLAGVLVPGIEMDKIKNFTLCFPSNQVPVLSIIVKKFGNYTTKCKNGYLKL